MTRRGRPPRYAQLPPAPVATVRESPLQCSGMLSCREVANLLHVKRRTIERCAKRGRLPVVRLGSPERPVLRFRASDVVAVMEGRSKEAP